MRRFGSFAEDGLASWLSAGLLVILLIGPLAGRTPADPPVRRGVAADPLARHQKDHRALREKFAATLESVAATARKNGFENEADRILELAEPPDPNTLRFEPLPEEVQPEIRLDLPEPERGWKSALRRAQQDFSVKLYLLAQRLVNQGHSSYAFQVLREAAFHDPDNKAVRSVLGFVRHEDQWVTPFRRDMLVKKNVWHEEFGWLKKDQVERYDAGERYFRGRWMTARQEGELRRDFDNAWEARTDHFLVKTNVSQERAVQIATALEEFHEFFLEAFASFFQSPEQLKKRFSSASMGSPRPEKPHVVHYLATRSEYVQKLKPKIPQIEITNGLYYTNDRIAYFFDVPGDEPQTVLFHEATHQLMYEVAREDRAIADREHFWIIEGIACYMESFRARKGGVSVGDPAYPRFDTARHRVNVEKYYVPLARFASMGLREFQSDPEISKNYTQAAGLAHFFMHYEGGKYRDALIEHLTQHYSVKRRSLPMVQGLDELTGTTYDDLDSQYRDYSAALQKTVAARRAARAPRPDTDSPAPRAATSPASP